MIVEVIAVGTELLLGQIVNSNAAFIGRALADAGLDAHIQVTVGDNLNRVASTIRQALERADSMIITGGIGPTQDDLTREAICAATGREMLFSEDYAAELRRRFAASGRVMPENNLRQAEYPAGATFLSNPKGSAPGMRLDHGGRLIYAVPGVPAEMELLLMAHVIPDLRRAAGIDEVLESRMLRTWGMSESQVAEVLDDLYQATTNPSVAFLASAGEIKVRISAKAVSRGEAAALIAPVEEEIRARLGSVVFGADEGTIEEVLLRSLGAAGWSLATAESVTGGMVAARLTDIPGASTVFRGSVVAYTSEVKQRLLGVSGELISEHGVVSEPVAEAMAVGVARLLRADVAVGLTGSAGPDRLEEDVGTVVIGVTTPEGSAARTMRLPGDRERVRAYASTAALHLVRRAVAGEWWTR
ncbi:MAG TPA: competence/damage-inducible protein A [Acidimicrobiia bacterium]|jgi:nicotinamide-nucleotide amidase|nr:competence/damage-inducible protein A [Acidimicrobiia bacterium]